MSQPEVNIELYEPTWLIYCAGRPTQVMVRTRSDEAYQAAKRLAAQWPGHEFVVYRAEKTFVAERPPAPTAPGSRFPRSQNF